MNVQFALLAYKTAPEPLASGQTFTAAGAYTTSIGALASLSVGDDTVCSSHPPGTFALEALPSSSCVVYPGIGYGTYPNEPPGTPIEVSADLMASGLCELRLTAPDLNAGQGLSTDFAVTVLNVEGLLRRP
jgi:hypothetical protein